MSSRSEQKLNFIFALDAAATSTEGRKASTNNDKAGQ